MMKGYTDIEQSKKLAETLPIESADMHYFVAGTLEKQEIIYAIRCGTPIVKTDIPCWSLAALLGVLPKLINKETVFIETSPVFWYIGYRNIYTAKEDNPVDACYELIVKLKELNLL